MLRFAWHLQGKQQGRSSRSSSSTGMSIALQSSRGVGTSTSHAQTGRRPTRSLFARQGTRSTGGLRMASISGCGRWAHMSARHAGRCGGATPGTKHRLPIAGSLQEVVNTGNAGPAPDCLLTVRAVAGPTTAVDSRSGNVLHLMVRDVAPPRALTPNASA